MYIKQLIAMITTFNGLAINSRLTCKLTL